MELEREPKRSDGFVKRFLDKWHGRDEKQVKALDTTLKEALIHGSPEEMLAALEIIKIREDFYRRELLGRAGLELILDMRATIELYQER